MSVQKQFFILDRFWTILKTVQNIETFAHNRGLLDNDQRPGLYLLDGDEVPLRSGAGRGRGRMSPGIYQLKPQVFVQLKVRKPQNETVGEDLAAYREEIITKVANDEQLLALLGSNGEIEYFGYETDLKSGMAMEGQIRLDFGLSYAFNPYS